MSATLQVKRGTAARWIELNPVLAVGEPGFEYDTKKLKIGDGTTHWKDLPYIGETQLVVVATYSELPIVGDYNCLYRVSNDKALYQWNTLDYRYERISAESFDPSKINLINGGKSNG